MGKCYDQLDIDIDERYEIYRLCEANSVFYRLPSIHLKAVIDLAVSGCATVHRHLQKKTGGNQT